jgi:hypothetical protein
MLKSYGGKQAILCDTLIKQEKGYLGTHLWTLRPGDIQKMAFQDSDDGPFWMTLTEREQRRFDIILRGTKMLKTTFVRFSWKKKEVRRSFLQVLESVYHEQR